MRWLIVLILPIPLLMACDKQPDTSLPTFEQSQLIQGKSIWMQVCRNCHLKGVAGAPAIGDAAAWQPRLAKGKAALYRNAINGIPQEQGWSMPPKGGMDRLSDTEVRHAVDYMLAAQAAIAERNQH